MATYYTSSGKAVQLESTPVTTPGGEGAVYKIVNTPSFSSHCAKIYHSSKKTDAKKRKLEVLISGRPSNYKWEFFMFCWPEALLFNSSNGFEGFIMPMAFAGSEKLYELATLKIAKKLDAGWHKFDRNTHDGFNLRLKLCARIAAAVHSLHLNKKYVITDLKPQNILVDKNLNISIIDVDSFQISNGLTITFPSDVLTPEYSPNEYHFSYQSDKKVTERWDRFALAVSFYEILFGLHPYAATANSTYSSATTLSEKIKHNLFVHGSKKNCLITIPKEHGKFSSLPSPVQSMFNRAFSENNSILERPSAEEWGTLLFTEVKRRETIVI